MDRFFVLKSICLAALTIISLHVCSQINIRFDINSPPITYGVNTLNQTLSNQGKTLLLNPRSKAGPQEINVISNAVALDTLQNQFPSIKIGDLKPEGFQILRDGITKITIVGGDEIGAMYGLTELSDLVKGKQDLFRIKNQIQNPHLEYRIIKFNLPWSPYRDNPATRLHTETCKDLHFWEKFLDMMVENRLNVLSLWNKHPFPYMIRSNNFPKATPFDKDEMLVWQNFWKDLFRMAKQRGIQTFIVNWNIVVSSEFAEAYQAEKHNDRSDLVKKYTRESVTQLINEYEDLTGIGVTLADWMNNFEGNMAPKHREDWIAETFVKGMQQANRKVKFLHRSVLSGSPAEMRRVIDQADLEDDALVEIKFNWSHGHSTPSLAITHDYHSGKVDDKFWNPKPNNYHIQWMIRNEDFFILRWGQPDFIRKHIEMNIHDYVNGYFIGSEGYIPAVDYSHKPAKEKTWEYAFEKQWLFYKLWGRLLYDPTTPNQVFEEAFDNKYGRALGEQLLKAYSHASKMPLQLASFYRSTWDYTLYSEGFLAPRASNSSTYFDGSSDFISIDELIYHETLDPNMMSIMDYVRKIKNKESISDHVVTPKKLADQLAKDGQAALEILSQIDRNKEGINPTLISELEDLSTWSYLSLYFSEKIRAGVALQSYRAMGNVQDQTRCIAHLQKALQYWQEVIEHTKDRYVPVPHVSIPEDAKEYKLFSWEYFLPQVERDITIAKTAIPEKN